MFSILPPTFHPLPTQHRSSTSGMSSKAELEALLEFIYRGEVSVANSELTGLIKIAESLRIKGLGDVSQRDQQQPLVGEKRPSSPPSPVSPPPHQSRPKKAPRLSSNSNANSYGHAINKTGGTKDGFAQLMDSGCPDMTDHMLDGEETPPKAESKLRSCLEGLESGPAAQSLAQSVAQSIVIPAAPTPPPQPKCLSGKKEAGMLLPRRGLSRGCISSRKKNQEPPEGRKPRGPTPVNSLSSASQDEIKDIKIPKEHIKTEMEADSMASGGGEGELPPSGPGDLSNPLLASYRNMLSMGGTEERAFSPSSHHRAGSASQHSSRPHRLPTGILEHPERTPMIAESVSWNSQTEASINSNLTLSKRSMNE
ncbi:Protein bric-a-brac 2 [Chionoecetes opilio]|uniref:Protein bric-a-brac 2 n=1 Tax=Chionoecetes opilio TaxID=41210 RepID=A0A8J5BXB6_CHIOP|nr:Protein bric-a-brac 2 [Chionoecetes opilio]